MTAKASRSPIRAGKRGLVDQQISRFALATHHLGGLGPGLAEPVCQHRLVALSGKSDVELVGQAAIDRDERPSGVLDRNDGVERDSSARHQ